MPAVTIQANEVMNLNVQNLLVDNAPQLIGKYGSVVFRYTAPFMRNLYAVAMVHDDGYPVAFHLDAVNQPETWKNGSREGIWWMPNASATQYLILTNQSDRLLPVVMSLYDAAGKASSQDLQLAARATQRFSVRELIGRAGLSGEYGGMRISSETGAGSLDTTSFVFDETAGFGAILKMFDRDSRMKLENRDFARTGVWTTRAPMLALSTPDPFLAFPAGTVLQPELLIRNTTNRTKKAGLRFNWRSGNAQGKAAVPELTLAGNETRRVDVKALQDAGTIPATANWASVILTSNGDPDDLIVIASSYDATLRHGAQTPFSDQLSVHMEGAEWEVDATHNSLIAAGNGNTVPIRAALTIFYNQGHDRYTLERTLQPEEQMWVDMAQLIRSRTPDKDGKVLPLELNAGSYQLMELEPKTLGSLYEGKVIIDKTFGHAAYGCMVCCGEAGGQFDLNPWIGTIGFTGGQTVSSMDNCSYTVVDTTGYYDTWWTDNTNVTTASFAQFTGIGAGTANGFAQGYVPSGTGQETRNGCPQRRETPQGPTVVTDNTPI